MFNNEALDVVIGIVLVYLLYSLLITILGEFVTNKLGLRPRMLRIAIERMLNDGYYDQLKTPPPKNQNWLVKAFLYEPPGFPDSFAGRFYEFPTIKYLSRVEKTHKDLFNNTKPSYFSGQYFADTLVAMLTEKSEGETEMERIDFTIKYNTQHIQPQTLRIILLHYVNANGDLNLFKAGLVQWFNETMDRCNGWYKRKMQLVLFLLGLIVATAFNVDTIKIANTLSRDKEARRQMVDIALKVSKDPKTYYYSSKTDSTRSDSVLKKSFEKVNDDIRASNMILGLGWPASAPLKSTELEVTATKENKDLYKALITLNISKDSVAAQIKKQKDTCDLWATKLTGAKLSYEIALSNYQLVPDSSNFASLDQMRKDTAFATKKLAAYRITFTRLKAAFTRSNTYFLDQTKQFLTPELRIIDSIKVIEKNKGIFLLSGQGKKNAWERFCFYLHLLWVALPGLIITAIALSLGAPFWFDLLNKLVSIRAAGVKPEEKKTDPLTTPGQPNAVTPQPAAAPNPVNDALDELTGKLLDFPGLIGLAKTADGKIRIMVNNDAARKKLDRSIGAKWPLTNGQTISLNIVVTSANELHYGPGSKISNEDNLGNQGTFGATLKKSGSKDSFIISCWHVMKDNNKFEDTVENKNIVVHNTATNIAVGQPAHQLIATIIEGALTNKADVGIAKLLETSTPIKPTDPRLVIKKQHRAVTDFDSVMNTPVHLVGFRSNYVNAMIFDHKLNVSLPYPDGSNRMIFDVFSIVQPTSNGKSFQAATSRGDSGAVVVEKATGAPLGMVVGGNGDYTYVMKFSNLFDPKQPYNGYSFIVET